jgi:hypothetical protein
MLGEHDGALNPPKDRLLRHPDALLLVNSQEL